MLAWILRRVGLSPIVENDEIWKHIKSFNDGDGLLVNSVCQKWYKSSIQNYDEPIVKLSSVVASIDALQQALQCGAPSTWGNPLYLLQWAETNLNARALHASITFGLLESVGTEMIFESLRSMLFAAALKDALVSLREALLEYVQIPPPNDQNRNAGYLLAAACGQFKLLPGSSSRLPREISTFIPVLLSFLNDKDTLMNYLQPRQILPNACLAAAISGSEDNLFALIDHGSCGTLNILQVVNCLAAGGHERIMPDIDDDRDDDEPLGNQLTYVHAALGGRLGFILWLRNQPSGPAPWDKHVVDAAYISGNVELVQWLYEQDAHQTFRNWFRLNDGIPILLASRKGNVDLLQWIYQHPEFCPRRLFSEASIGAASTGQIVTLEWMHKHKLPAAAETIVTAASHGQVKLLRWLRTPDARWINNSWTNPTICVEAALHGKLHVLRWLRDHDVPWDESVISAAVASDHLPTLQWLINNGAPYSEAACRIARLRNNPRILKFLSYKRICLQNPIRND